MGERHRFRAEWHDYNCGVYFVTICTKEGKSIFGRISPDCEFFPTRLGEIVERHINRIGEHFNGVEIYNYVVMPNHVHLVIAINVGEPDKSRENHVDELTGRKLGCLKPPIHEDGIDDFHHNSRLAVIISTFKAGVTREARRLHNSEIKLDSDILYPRVIWQPRFYEHIIRNNQAFEKIMNYIDNNIATWGQDCYYY